MRFHDLKNIYTFVFVIVLLSSQFFSLIGTAADSDNLVEANFDIVLVSGTQMTIDITVTPKKLTTDRVYFHSDILSATSEELGALKYAVFLMLKDQLSNIFRGVSLDNFSLPAHQAGVFTESLDLTLDSAFFNMNSTVNAQDFVNGFLDMGASISYVFPFSAEPGWNNTYTIVLSSEMILEAANTVDVSSDGTSLTWKVENWFGNGMPAEGQLSIKEINPSTTIQTEDISILFEIDSGTPSTINLDSKIITKSLDLEPYNILPDFITHIEYLPADGIRLLIKNQLLSWQDIYNITYRPITQHIKTVIENTSFNQTYDAVFNWDPETTTNATNPYSTSQMDASPPLTGILSDKKIEFSYLGISGRAFYGLLNAGATATLSANDINFGTNLQTLNYPYTITLVLPTNVFINNQETITWTNTTEFGGNFTSQNIQQNPPTEEYIEEYITIDISKMDLNILGLITGTLEMNTAITITSDEYQFITTPPPGLTLPQKLKLDLLNADALRLCIDEYIFTPEQITNYFQEKKEYFNTEYITLLHNLELNGIFDEPLFFNSLEWDGDITSMDALNPIQTTIISKSLHPTKLNISLIPPSIQIANQTFHLKGIPKKTVIYTILFPKGITIDPLNINTSNIHQDQDADGRQFIEYTISPANSQLSQTITFHLTASPLYVLSILLPLFLSIVLVIILIFLIYFFRRRRQGKIPKQSHPPSSDYYNQNNYIPPPPEKPK